MGDPPPKSPLLVGPEWRPPKRPYSHAERLFLGLFLLLGLAMVALLLAQAWLVADAAVRVTADTLETWREKHIG